MKILGIESSCDETAAAVVENGSCLLSNVINSQIDIHAQYGGVVPEIAARSHLEVINPVINKALADANCDWNDIDAVAVTYAPGLIGSLLVGTLAARTAAILHDKPLYKIHHVEAHVYANFITSQQNGSLILPSEQPSFPLLALIVSGGHSQLVFFKNHGEYELIGQTQDDAIGEAFDKVAKMLGLPYPGGPSVANTAKSGNPHAFELPIAKLSGKYDFSFSGLKTAVLRRLQREIGADFTFPSHKLPERVSDALRRDMSASFQFVAIETLVQKTLLAYNDMRPRSVVVAGGVGANRELRSQLADSLPIPISYAPTELCTDNAAMIGALGYYRQAIDKPADPYDFEVKPSLSMLEIN